MAVRALWTPVTSTVLDRPACGRTDLLEVGGEAVHVLVVGQDGVGLGVEEVDVPDAEQRQQNRRVALQGSGAEVVVLEWEGIGYVLRVYGDFFKCLNRLLLLFFNGMLIVFVFLH